MFNLMKLDHFYHLYFVLFVSLALFVSSWSHTFYSMLYFNCITLQIRVMVHFSLRSLFPIGISSSFSMNIYWKGSSFLIELPKHLWQKSIDHMCVDLSRLSLFSLLLHLFVLWPMPHYLDHWHLNEVLKSGSVHFLSLFFLKRFDYSTFFPIPYKF